MTREEFMQEARMAVRRILESKENAIMNLVQQAWAEGKRNAEVETITELVKQAFVQGMQKDAVTVKAPDNWISVKDGLPEVGGQYLVVSKPSWTEPSVKTSWFLTNLRDNGQFELEGEPNEPGFYDGDCECDWVERNITHWMPMPELPKEE